MRAWLSEWWWMAALVVVGVAVIIAAALSGDDDPTCIRKECTAATTLIPIMVGKIMVMQPHPITTCVCVERAALPRPDAGRCTP